MREIRLYSDQSLEEGGSVQLDAGAAHHLVKVLRAQVGDTITLFNGTGLDWQCSISALEKRAVTLSVGNASNPNTESPLATQLGLCLSKGDRFDWAIQKATEAGVTNITPLYSDRVDENFPPTEFQNVWPIGSKLFAVPVSNVEEPLSLQSSIPHLCQTGSGNRALTLSYFCTTAKREHCPKLGPAQSRC